MTSSQLITTGLTLCLSIALLTSCGEKSQPQRPAQPVSVVTVHNGEVPLTYNYAARVAAFRETEVRARVGGILLHRNFDEGAEVVKGQVLFEIDPDTYEAAVERAKAQVAQAQATFDQSVRDATRAEELVKQKVQSTAQREQAFATRDANGAALKQAKAELRTAELNLEYTKVTAPISGLTSREAVSEGSLIGTDSASSLLTTITQTDPIYVNFSYTDGDAREIRQLVNAMKERGERVDNLSVKVRLGDGTTYPEPGSIDFTSPTLDVLTGTLGVRAVVPNPDRQLIPGQFVRVTVEGVKLANALTIPEKALMQDANGTYVFIVQKVDQPAKDGQARPIYLATKRAVVVDRQLENRDWLLKNVNDSLGDQRDQPAQAGNVDPIGGHPAIGSGTQKVVGIRDGEQLIISGQFTIQTALASMGPNAPGLPISITSVDGQAVAKEPGLANGQKDGQ